MRGAHATGLNSIVRRSRWRTRRLLILCYHGVATRDEHEWDPLLYITQERLRERLKQLIVEDHKILGLAEALRQLSVGTLPPRAVALTFDDGPSDFASHAVPVLQEFNAPATVYLTTYYCEHRSPVFDPALSYLLWRGRDSDPDLSDLADASGPIRIHSPADREATWLALTRAARLRGLSTIDKHAFLRQVAERVGVDFDAFVDSRILQIMTPSQVRALPTDLIDVQLHTHRHRTPRVEQEFVRELQDNQAAIARLTGIAGPRTHFCYPSGDYAQCFLPWLRDQGVTSATTCIPGLAHKDSDFLLLPRFVDSMSTTSLTFDAWTSGVAELLPRRARYRLDKARG